MTNSYCYFYCFLNAFSVRFAFSSFLLMFSLLISYSVNFMMYTAYFSLQLNKTFTATISLINKPVKVSKLRLL